MLTAMRAEIIGEPKLQTIKNPKTSDDLLVANVLLGYQKEEGGNKTFVPAVAWAEKAENLAQKKSGDVIEFAGTLSGTDYKHPSMEKPRRELCFTINAIDESQTICQKLEEYMGVVRREQDKPGAVFQPVRGKLFEDPVLATVEGKDGKPLEVCNATLRHWDGVKGHPDTLVAISAFGNEAKALSEMKKGYPIQFVGRLDSRIYKNENMDKGHAELCFNVYSIDPERKLAKNANNFIQEEMGLKPKLKDKIYAAEQRITANAGAKDVKEMAAEPVR